MTFKASSWLWRVEGVAIIEGRAVFWSFTVHISYTFFYSLLFSYLTPCLASFLCLFPFAFTLGRIRKEIKVQDEAGDVWYWKENFSAADCTKWQVFKNMPKGECLQVPYKRFTNANKSNANVFYRLYSPKPFYSCQNIQVMPGPTKTTGQTQNIKIFFFLI